MQIQAILLPALTVARDGSIVPVDDLDKLRIATPFALAGRYFSGLVIFDASGIAHHVEGAAPLSEGLGWLLRRFLNRRTKVELKIVRSKPYTLNDLKLAIVECIRKDRNFWEAGGSILRLEDAVNEAESLAALVAVFR